MKILFGVQTEGNGHITQAIAVKQYLKQNGYDVSKAFAASKKRGLSKYFTDEFDVVTYEGFDFVFDKEGRVIIWKTLLKNTLELPRLILSFIKICNVIRKEKPDAIFNYYEPLVGLTSLFFRNIKYVSFGHQYAMDSSIYPRINGFETNELHDVSITSLASGHILQSNGSLWQNNNRLHSRHGYRWVKPCHEVTEYYGDFFGGEEKSITVNTVVRHRPDDNKSRSQYLPMLQIYQTLHLYTNVLYH